MPKFLVRGSYTADGLHGVLAEGGSGRRDATKEAIEALGGRLESFYFAFGSDDFIVIADCPITRLPRRSRWQRTPQVSCTRRWSS